MENLKLRTLSLAASSILVAAFGIGVQSAHATITGTVILEGSDAIGYHSTLGDPGAITYRDEMWHAIGGLSPLNIAVIGAGTFGVIGGGATPVSHPVANFSSIGDAATAGGILGLTAYSAIYIAGGGGCCEEQPLNAGDDVLLLGYLASGSGHNTVVISNYIGGSQYDTVLGTTSANSHVIGVGGGAGPGTGCDDGEKVTADGLANGFVQPPVLGCWEHQGYDMAYFGPLGFTHNFFDAALGMGGAGWSGLLSTGVTITGLPEPMTLSLFGTGLLGLGAARLRRKAKV